MGEAQIVVGNERVLKARLADARHFWEQDRKTSLAAHAAALGNIVFHAQLGTLDQKVDRVQALAVALTDRATINTANDSGATRHRSSSDRATPNINAAHAPITRINSGPRAEVNVPNVMGRFPA